MRPDVKLESLNLKATSYQSWLGSIQVNLSNDESSPVFQNSDPEMEYVSEETIDLSDVDIRSVGIIFRYEYIDSLLFYDGNNQLVEVYDPQGFSAEQHSANPTDRYARE